MRVTFVAPYTLPLVVGGFESQVYHIYESLKNIGVDVRWHNLENSTLDNVDVLQVMSTDSSMIPLMRRAKIKGIKVVITPMMGSRARSNTYLKAALMFSKIPQLFTAHKQTMETINCADHLTPLCTYEADRMTYVYGFKRTNITVIPNGIDDSFFDNDVADIPLPYDQYILTVGRVEQNKNQYTLIKVAKTLGMNLVIVGEQGEDGVSYLNKCKAIANNNIYFWGVERNPHTLKQLYRNAMVTVIPSYSEMVPLVAFESLSQKTPVVCTNRCGIAKDNIYGLIYTGIDEYSLKKSIIDACSIDRKVIDRTSIHTWNDIAMMYKNVYSKLLS